MKRILLGLGLLLWASLAHSQTVSGPPYQITCNQSAQVSPTTGTTTQLAAAVAGRTIYICGWHVTVTAASTFQLEYGTGATCTSPTTLTPAFNVATSAPSGDHIDYAFMATAVNTTLCVVIGGTGPAQVMVYYAQY